MNAIKDTSLFEKVKHRVVRALEVLLFSNRYSIYSQQIYSHHLLSFSQEGEDMILRRLFENRERGFYVDVGAHHPQRFSNTYFFYLRGWRGINIDAMPGSMVPFEKLRPEDTNIEAAISDFSEELTYYSFNEPALNSFSEPLSKNRDGVNNYEIVDKRLIKTKRLSEIFDEYLPLGQEITFLSVDVEGLDYQVLLSNDWSKYKPEIVLVEELSDSLDTSDKVSRTYCLLKEQGYEIFSRTFNTSFYKLVSA